MEPAPERQCDSWRRSCTPSARGGPVSDSFGRRADDLPARRRLDVRLRRRGDVTVSETHLKQRDRGTTTRTGVTRPFLRLTFGAAVREVLDDYRINRRRSLVDVERHVRLHLGPFFGRRRMAAITTTDVRRYVARRQDEGAKNATINRELSVLQRAFTLAIAAGTLPSRPHIALLREDNVRRVLRAGRIRVGPPPAAAGPGRPRVVPLHDGLALAVRSRPAPLDERRLRRRRGPARTRHHEDRRGPRVPVHRGAPRAVRMAPGGHARPRTRARTTGRVRLHAPERRAHPELQQ